MRERVCKNCGGRQYKVVGQNMVKCQFCGTLYVDEQASKEEEILLVSAYEKLRECRFEEAVCEFDKILSLYPKSFEAFYGKAQAKNKLIFYVNRRGLSKKPRFFGDSICDFAGDEDFQKAVQNAPEEIAANYQDNAKRIERERKLFEEIKGEQNFDVVLWLMDSNDEDFEKTQKLAQMLESRNIKTYFLQNLDGKEREAETFNALKKSKVFLLVANKKIGYNDSEVKNLIDRYRYFISNREKYSMGFVIAVDKEKLEKEELPQELSFCKNYVDFTPENFEECVANVQNVIEKTPKEIAKLEKRKIEKVKPIRKEYISVDEIVPTELGHYKVENIEADDVIKTKWVFLSLKNGDFEATKQIVEAELEKDPNNAEMLFAKLLCEKKLRTAGEFFQSISNFTDKEKLDKILLYSTKEFAEMFVDNWEKTIEKTDNEENYNTYLLYLAKFTTPNRENFIEKAREKAIETLDQELIEKVEKCFKAEDVDDFVKFYFELAQKTGNQDYYTKILDIDQGHKQSNIAMLLQCFKTNEDKLTFRDKEKIEKHLQFLNETERNQAISMILDVILPVAFLDMAQAEEQIDFYLSYVEEDNIEILKKVSNKFMQMHFFKQAEKYLTLAISRDKKNAELYWELIKSRAHCVSETELVRSVVDVTKFPEWETLLHYASDEQTEHFAEIVSKSHLFEGRKKPVEDELTDKAKLIERLSDFINRNNQILIDIQKENGEKSIKGCTYFNLQLAPFENYLESLKQTENFDEYVEIAARIYQRLFFLDLTLESSINVIQVDEKSSGLKNISVNENQTKKTEKLIKNYKEKTEHKKFWKWFCFGFFEFAPVLFLTILLSISIFDLKKVYAYFPQNFVLGLLFYAVAIGITNLILYVIKKQKLNWKTKMPIMMLIVFAFLNVVLLATGFYVTKNEIKIYNANEFETFVNNATYSTIIFENDIDMQGKSVAVGSFFGNIDGKGFTLKNVSLKNGNKVALIKTNYGNISNLNITLANGVYNNVESFAVFAINNVGVINNCTIGSSLIEIKVAKNAVVGGFAANLCGGKVENSLTALNLTIKTPKDEIMIGEIAGKITADSVVSKNIVNGHVSVIEANQSRIYFGGLTGYVGNFKKSSITQNQSNINLTIDGEVAQIYVGGLIGYGWAASNNNYSAGEVSVSGSVAEGYVGGLYGVYKNHDRESYVEYSYSRMTANELENLQIRGLVGGECGSVRNSYSSADYDLMGSIAVGTRGCDESCDKSIEGYDTKFGFSNEIWNNVESTSEIYPTLK